MFKAEAGDTVTVSYTGRLKDGTVFDASPDGKPLMFILGRQEVIAGFDAAVGGMVVGEKRTVTVPPEQAYGKAKPELVEEVERKNLPEDIDLRPGIQLEVTRHDNSKFHVMVQAVTEATVTLDANHPLADRELTFDIDLIDIQKQQAQQ
ncbi:MAG TPA: peptidylprolyl isomerase [Desulfuromonadales bacterium]|nr:peptidylprolyl isomerase [Desulfuromonadales bacterium]